MTIHPAKRLMAPDGEPADIDVLLVPLIEALWYSGYDTIGSCQDLGESIAAANPRRGAYWSGYVLLEMPDQDAARLVDAVSTSPVFAPRMHWAAEGAWEVSSPMLALPDGAERIPWMQVHFPASQLDDLVTLVRSGSP